MLLRMPVAVPDAPLRTSGEPRYLHGVSLVDFSYDLQRHFDFLGFLKLLGP